MVPRTRTVSCAEAVPILDAIIATAPRTTLASAATLYLAFISSSHWLAYHVAILYHAPRGSIPIRNVKSGPVVWVPRSGSAYPCGLPVCGTAANWLDVPRDLLQLDSATRALAYTRP